MHRKWYLVAYGAVGAILVVAALAAPAAWATSGQSVVAQTIPTRTPPAPPVETAQPAPENTAVPPTAVPSATAGGDCATDLTLVADNQTVWQGATVVFTATLSNAAPQPLKDIVLENQLAAGLEPVAVLRGGGHWQGRTLRVEASSLDPAGSLSVVYSARVGVPQRGRTLTAQASASVAGCPPKKTSLALGLPPSLLPATGGQLP